MTFCWRSKHKYKVGSQWKEYTPKGNVLLVIAPGAGTYMNRKVYDTLKRASYEVIVVGDRRYDHYPDNWETGKPDLNGRTLATLATDILAPVVKRLVREGKGPSALLCGSRGGQVTLGQMWKNVLLCPTLCINAGFLTSNTKIPREVRLMCLSFGKDYFRTKTKLYCHRKYKQLAPKKRCALLYHSPNDKHMPQNLYKDIATLVFVLLAGDMALSADLVWRAPSASVCMMRSDPGLRSIRVCPT
jgi:hypothetical protein